MQAVTARHTAGRHRCGRHARNGWKHGAMRFTPQAAAADVMQDGSGLAPYPIATEAVAADEHNPAGPCHLSNSLRKPCATAPCAGRAMVVDFRQITQEETMQL